MRFLLTLLFVFFNFALEVLADTNLQRKEISKATELNEIKEADLLRSKLSGFVNQSPKSNVAKADICREIPEFKECNQKILEMEFIDHVVSSGDKFLCSEQYPKGKARSSCDRISRLKWVNLTNDIEWIDFEYRSGTYTLLNLFFDKRFVLPYSQLLSTVGSSKRSCSTPVISGKNFNHTCRLALHESKIIAEENIVECKKILISTDKQKCIESIQKKQNYQKVFRKCNNQMASNIACNYMLGDIFTDSGLSIKSCKGLQNEEQRHSCLVELALRNNDPRVCLAVSVDISKVSCLMNLRRLRMIQTTKTAVVATLSAAKPVKSISYGLVSSSLPKAPKFKKILETEELVVTREKHRIRKNPTGHFKSVSGKNSGLRGEWSTPLIGDSFLQPVRLGQASGDINGDGWDDLVFWSSLELQIYLNNKGKMELTFQGQHREDSLLSQVNLLDWNNDGRLDLLLYYSGLGLFVGNNNGKEFLVSQEAVVKTEKSGDIIWFFDLNNDGQLDTITADTVIHFPGIEPMTMAQMVSPVGFVFSNKGKSHFVLAAKSIGGPHLFVWNKVKGRFDWVDKVQTGSPLVTSISGADFDNDLELDFLSSTKSTALEEFDLCSRLSTKEKNKCQNYFELSDNIRRENVSYCDKKLNNKKLNDEKKYCYLQILFRKAKNIKSPKACDLFFNSSSGLWNICRNNIYGGGNSKFRPPLKKWKMGLLLNKWSSKDIYVEESKLLGLKAEGPTNSSVAEDFDGDTYVDVVLAAGDITNRSFFPTTGYRNINGKLFESVHQEYRLGGELDNQSLMPIDYNRDGLVDLVGPGFFGKGKFLENQLSKNNSISISLVDELGNRDALGAQIIIEFVENGTKKKITRYITFGGNLKTFPSARGYFGLGKAREIEYIKIIWPDGKQQVAKMKFQSGFEYKFRRLNQ